MPGLCSRLHGLSGSGQASRAARTADAERATVADNVGATIRDAGQFTRAQRSAGERGFRYGKARALGMNRRAEAK